MLVSGFTFLRGTRRWVSFVEVLNRRFDAFKGYSRVGRITGFYVGAYKLMFLLKGKGFLLCAATKQLTP